MLVKYGSVNLNWGKFEGVNDRLFCLVLIGINRVVASKPKARLTSIHGCDCWSSLFSSRIVLLSMP